MSELPKKGEPPVLGEDLKTGAKVELTTKARRQGVYVIGTTGCGKTTLLQNLAYADMEDPTRPGLCVLDPHGDFIDELLLRVPECRQDDVILFDPGGDESGQLQKPLGLNLLECDRKNPKQVYRVTSTVVDTLRKLFFYSWGPRMEDLLRHSILTLMETDDTTLLDLLLILASKKHRKDYVAVLTDPVLQHFWEVQFEAYDRRQRVEVVGSSLNKIGRFLANPLIRRIVAQPSNAFDMAKIMKKGKILLVNLAKGDLGEDNSSLLGAVIVNLVLIGALQRREIHPDDRRPFHLIVDEFQNFSSESFATLQSEARKYAVDVIVAHQYRDQLDENLRGSTLNVANVVAMRTTGVDGFELAGQFDNTPPEPDKAMESVYQPSSQALRGIEERLFESFKSPGGATGLYREKELPRRLYSDVQAEAANQLTIKPNFMAYCRLVGEDERSLVEYRIKTLEPQGEKDTGVADYIRRESLKLGTPWEEVDAAVAAKIKGFTLDKIVEAPGEVDVSRYGDRVIDEET